jgi:hypothetical protein
VLNGIVKAWFSWRNANYFACFFWIATTRINYFYLIAHNSKETGEIFRISPRKSARGIRPLDSNLPLALRLVYSLREQWRWPIHKTNTQWLSYQGKDSDDFWGPLIGIREFTNVRWRRQDDGFQYNNINPIAQKKWIIKSLVGVLDVVQALLTTAKCIFSRPV